MAVIEYLHIDDPGAFELVATVFTVIIGSVSFSGSIVTFLKLQELVATYNPEAHPIIGPLLEGGPAALVRRNDLPHEDAYIDACHLCYTARDQLRGRFPEFLAPATVYGEL